jgi:hypothetical protein
MAHHIWSLDVYWDGHRLVAHPAFHDGWGQLSGTSPKQPAPVKALCNELEDLTPFEVGVFLGLAVRPFTDGWRSEPDLFRVAVELLPKVTPTA